MSFRRPLVTGNQSLNGITTQRPTATVGEYWSRWLGGTLAEPLGQDSDRFLAEWGTALFPALALAAEVSPRAKGDVVASQANEFGHPQPCLDGHHQQGPIPAAYPGRLVGRPSQRVNLLRCEVLD